MKTANEASTLLRRRNRRTHVAEHERQRKRLIMVTLAALVSLSLLITLILGENGLLTYFDRKETVQQLRRENQVISVQNEEINRELDIIRNGGNDFEYEQRARGFGFAYQGERIYKFVPFEQDKQEESEVPRHMNAGYGDVPFTP